MVSRRWHASLSVLHFICFFSDLFPNLNLNVNFMFIKSCSLIIHMSFASLCFSLFLFDIIFLYGVVVAVHFATLSFSLPLFLFIALVGNHPLLTLAGVSTES